MAHVPPKVSSINCISVFEVSSTELSRTNLLTDYIINILAPNYYSNIWFPLVRKYAVTILSTARTLTFCNVHTKEHKILSARHCHCSVRSYQSYHRSVQSHPFCRSLHFHNCSIKETF